VPHDEHAPRGRRFLGTDRLTAFSDGIFSIAATLLVLDIAVHPPGTLDQVLGPGLPTWRTSSAS